MHNNGRAETALLSGYSKTKIGKLPSSWEVVSLEDVTDPSAPIRYGVVQIGPDTPDGVPIVPIKHIRRINDVMLHRASPDIEAAYAGSRVMGGDVLVSVKGTIGDVGVVPSGFEGNIAREIARIRPKSSCDADFLSFQLQADHTQRRIDSKVVGSTRLEFSIHAVRDFLIALPPPPEQRKIAEILRTWDEAIEKLEALRAAKQRRLAGIIQRLVGRGGAFPERWQLRPLSAISDRVRRQNGGNNHPVMTISAKSGFLMQSDKFARDMAGSSVERYIVLHEGEFAYNKGNSLTAPYGCVFPLDRSTALVPFVYFCFAMKKGFDHAFYGHLFAAGALNHQLSRLINSGVRNDGLLNLNVDDFFNCRVPVPPIGEQKRIAAALSAAKTELSLLDAEMEATTRQKRGLMQKLLTGEWRVKLEPAVA
jgi:type I restriction enzyme S subunit